MKCAPGMSVVLHPPPPPPPEKNGQKQILKEGLAMETIEREAGETGS